MLRYADTASCSQQLVVESTLTCRPSTMRVPFCWSSSGTYLSHNVCLLRNRRSWVMVSFLADFWRVVAPQCCVGPCLCSAAIFFCCAQSASSETDHLAWRGDIVFYNNESTRRLTFCGPSTILRSSTIFSRVSQMFRPVYLLCNR